MDRLSRRCLLIWLMTGTLIVLAAGTVFFLTPSSALSPVSAHTSDTYGPACGAAIIDGVVDPAEWASASVKTFHMISGSGADPFTATLYVMNSGYYLYMGIIINDDEFSTYGNFLPQGDGFRIDFDNDRSGSIYTLNDDVLDISAGLPQFRDNYIEGDPENSSSDEDVNGGGTSDGSGVARRVSNLNHFELRHPLCSGDKLDFCRPPTSIVGFKLEYLDAEGDGSFGGTQLYPDLGDTAIADIVMGSCTANDLFTYLPYLQK
jgi:hypothetical protein